MKVYVATIIIYDDEFNPGFYVTKTKNRAIQAIFDHYYRLQTNEWEKPIPKDVKVEIPIRDERKDVNLKQFTKLWNEKAITLDDEANVYINHSKVLE